MKVEKTNPESERTKAIKVTYRDGKKDTVILKGAISELFYRALMILYDKRSNYDGNYSLETSKPPSTHTRLFTVNGSNIENKDIIEFSKFAIVTDGLISKRALVIIGANDSSDRYEILNSFAKHYDVPVILIKDSSASLDDILIEIESNL